MGLIQHTNAYIDHHKVCRLCRQSPIEYTTTNNRCEYGNALFEQALRTSGLTRYEFRELCAEFYPLKTAPR